MNIKKIFFALIVSTLLIGSVCAGSVNDFKVDGYKNTYDSNYNSAYLNDNGNSGVYIYKNANGAYYDLDDDGYDDYDDNDHDLDDRYDLDDDGHYDYDNHYDDDAYDLDDDAQITKNSDNTATFKDFDDAEHGVTEVVQTGGEKYTVVFWAKDSSNINNADLMSKLTDFNKDNGVAPVAF